MAAQIRLTREFAFESAHALEGYDGKCREIHGHSYRLLVTVAGSPSEREDDPKRGMVMDFGELKRIVGQEIVERLDHSFVMRRTPGSERMVEALKGEFRNVILVDWQPTCENMLCDFARCLRAALPHGVRLHSLRLHETALSYAEWYADDNENM